jgi:hypothetical protein
VFDGTVERGTETDRVTVSELTGDERDRVCDDSDPGAIQASRTTQRTGGIRRIPVPGAETFEHVTRWEPPSISDLRAGLRNAGSYTVPFDLAFSLVTA